MTYRYRELFIFSFSVTHCCRCQNPTKIITVIVLHMVGSVVVFFWQALNVIMTMMTWTKYLDIPYKIPIGIMYVDIHFCATMMMMMIKRRICNGTCNYREIEKPQTKYLLSPSVSGPVYNHFFQWEFYLVSTSKISIQSQLI